jgi:hypothetical protein
MAYSPIMDVIPWFIILFCFCAVCAIILTVIVFLITGTAKLLGYPIHLHTDDDNMKRRKTNALVTVVIIIFFITGYFAYNNITKNENEITE